ncbi:MAG: endonuclease [Candidatus Riflebacteria bacterium HGW-Riflebacteria-2]|jgi:endonuclease G|nr:MAG: endonuclease [Candidatus Riflebacteria bacterium HGW-Riflebacteria-2]
MPTLFNRKRGALQPAHLIAIILLLTFIGIAVYYWHQSKTTKPPVVIAPTFIPVEAALVEETRRQANIVYGGQPATASQTKLTLLKNIGFYAGYCDERRNPLWVAYRLDAKDFEHRLSRPKSFSVDHRTLSRVDPKEYAKSGYDRGHLAPNSAIATRFGRDAQLETFKMSNIVPQTPELNRRVWQRLEKFEEDSANNRGSIWVIAGPVFDEHIKTIGNNIEVPDAFFKIVIDEEQEGIKAIAFLIPQTVTGKEPIEHFLTSIDEIEKLTGLDFFWPLSDEAESRLESSTAASLW